MTLKVDIKTELEVAEEKIRDFIETIPAGKTVLISSFPSTSLSFFSMVTLCPVSPK